MPRKSLVNGAILVALLVVASFTASLQVWYAVPTEPPIVDIIRKASRRTSSLQSSYDVERVKWSASFLNESRSSLNGIERISTALKQQQTNLSTGYHTLEEQNGRSHRFPSIEERLQVYMTSWYLPPANNDTSSDDYIQYAYYNTTDKEMMMVLREVRTAKEKKAAKVRTFLIDDTTTFDTLHFLRSKTVFRASCNNAYCEDFIQYLFPTMLGDDVTGAPLLFQFSDIEKTIAFSLSTQKTSGYPNMPTLKKFRPSLTRTERRRLVSTTTHPRPVPPEPYATTQPIIFKLKTQRHYGPVASVSAHDRPYTEKRDQAVFRGQFTGRWSAYDLHQEVTSFADQCYYLPRCRLVVESANSSLVDAALTLPIPESRRAFPTELQGIPLYGERMSVAELLSYKAIIMLEGNDVSSGLKWALFSNSVVLMTPPTKTSWAMEELLEAWVHYVPLAEDLSNVESRMEWVLQHPMEAQEIARRGRLWISDLVFHPDAEADEQEIFRRMVDHYQRHFHYNQDLLIEEADTLRAFSTTAATSE